MSGIFRYAQPSSALAPVWTGTSISLDRGAQFSLLSICPTATSFISGPLPSGVSILSANLLAVVNATAGTVNVSFTAINANGSTPQTIALTINPVALNFVIPASLTLAQGGAPIDLNNYKIGGLGAFSFAQTAGQAFALGGLTLSAAGFLSAAINAIVQTTGGYKSTVTDSQPVATQSNAFAITVTPGSVVQQFSVAAGEALPIAAQAQFAIPAGYGQRTGFVLDPTLTNPVILQAASGITMLPGLQTGAGIINASLTATQGLFHNLYFRVTYTNHAADIFGPFDLNVTAPLAKGFTLYHASAPTVPVNTYQHVSDIPSGTLQANDVITVQPNRTYVGRAYNINLGTGPYTVQSAVAGQKWTFDCSGETDIRFDGVGNIQKIIEGHQLTVTDHILVSLGNSGFDSSTGLINVLGANWALPQSLTVRNGELRGGGSGTTNSAPQFSQTANIGAASLVSGMGTSPLVATIPLTAPYKVTVVAPVTNGVSSPPGQWRWFGGADPIGNGSSNVLIAGVNAARTATNYSTAAPLPGGFNHNLNGNNGDYYFNAADAGKAVTINFGLLPPNWASDTSTMTVVNTKFSRFGGGTGPDHPVYANHIGGAIYFEGVWSADNTAGGYLVKSKGFGSTTLHACRLGNPLAEAGFAGDDACLDGSILGRVIAKGVIFIKAAGGSGNAYVCSLGQEWLFFDLSDLRNTSFEAYQCTFINLRPDGVMFQLGRSGVSAANDKQLDGTLFPLKAGLSLANVPGSGLVIKDCVMAGYNAPTISGNTTLVSVNSSTTLAQLNALLAAQFEDPANANYRPLTPIVGSQSWTSLEYVHPNSTKARTDAYMGAVSPLSVPFWATPAKLQAGTWTQITDSNTLQDATINPSSGSTASNKPWSGGGNWFEVMTQWSGGCLVPDYAQHGGIAMHGNGHAASHPSYYGNGVAVWNVSTARYEKALDNWFDPTQCLPASSLLLSGQVGSATATLLWSAGASWHHSDPTQSNQADADLVLRQEYVANIPAATHTYFGVAWVPAQWGGGTKGGIFVYPGQAPGGQNAESGSTQPFSYMGFPASINFGGHFAHTADLAAGVWSRWAPAGTSGEVARSSAQSLMATCTDWRRGKIYCTGTNPSINTPGFGTQSHSGSEVFDLTKSPHEVRICSLTSFTWPDSYGGTATWHFVPHPTDPTQDIVIGQGQVNGSGPVVRLACWAAWLAALGSPAAGTTGDSTTGWWVCNVSGSLPATYQNEQHNGVSFCQDLPLNGNGSICVFMGVTDMSSMSIWGLSVPNNRRTGTYQWVEYPLVKMGTSAANNPGAWDLAGANQVNGLFTRGFCYLPKAKCFWLGTREDVKPWMLRPTELGTLI